jgi:hypothetical protein
MGITSPLQRTENTSNGQVVAEPPDAPPGVDDEGVDVALFALFMRSTLAWAGHRHRQLSNGRRQQPVQPDRLRRVPRPQHHDRAAGDADQRRRARSAPGNKIIHSFSDFRTRRHR